MLLCHVYLDFNAAVTVKPDGQEYQRPTEHEEARHNEAEDVDGHHGGGDDGDCSCKRLQDVVGILDHNGNHQTWE